MRNLKISAGLTLVMIGLLVSEANAQVNYFSMQYSMGFGSGETSSYISKPSFRGFTMEYRKYVEPSVGVGFEAGWNVFYERKNYDSYTQGPATLTGVQYRSSNHVPIYLAADYFLSPDAKVNPFFGLGIGTLYSERATDMGLYRLTEDAWQFSVRPQAGVLFELNSNTSAIIAAKYYAGFETEALPAQSYFALNVGFVFTKR